MRTLNEKLSTSRKADAPVGWVRPNRNVTFPASIAVTLSEIAVPWTGEVPRLRKLAPAIAPKLLMSCLTSPAEDRTMFGPWQSWVMVMTVTGLVGNGGSGPGSEGGALDTSRRGVVNEVSGPPSPPVTVTIR